MDMQNWMNESASIVREGTLTGSPESPDSARDICQITVQNKMFSLRKTLLRNSTLLLC